MAAGLAVMVYVKVHHLAWTGGHRHVGDFLTGPDVVV
jgi:hypothetical protein